MLSKEELGRYLKQLREIKGLSLREVDKLSDISYTHLNMIENGNLCMYYQKMHTRELRKC